MRLDGVEARVVGSLVEKQLTTPQQYPLTLNGLALACNQSSNRAPVVSYSEQQVQEALDSLKQKGLVRFVLPSHGRSVIRYRHVLDEKLALDGRQLALVAVLLLRGPQTVGELRTRTERMARFDSTTEVESDLEGLTRWEDPLVARMPRRPGQKEERWTQLLTDAVDLVEDDGAGFDAGAGYGPDPGAGRGSRPESRAGRGSRPESGLAEAGDVSGVVGAGAVTALEQTLGDLRREVDLLREEVLELRLELAEVREGR